ncbi:MAG: M20 family metallopeptidase [Spirochaetota bacterium]|nr:M20 family metallopeptidase [Spirochaetota bacterium]
MRIEELDKKKQAVYQRVDELTPELVDISKQIHAHPETNYEEYFASDLLSGKAEEAGFKVQRRVADIATAFKAVYRGRKEAPVVAFLSEYDALPEVGHACGHNLIGTAGLGAALAVASAVPDIPGTVQLIGTPAEEGGGGKIVLVDGGVFDEVDAAMMFHPSPRNQLWKYAMASRIVEIEFFGKAAHAASSPEEGINALDAVIQTFNNINALRQHMRSDVRIHGIILDGGKAPNIVPDHASALFYVRSLDDDYCVEMVKKVRDCAVGASSATGAELKFHEKGGAYKTLKTNRPLTEAFQRNSESLGLVFDENEPMDDVGSTDMGNVSHITPSIHPYLKIGADSLIYHSREFAEAASSEQGFGTMILAAKAMAATALDFFFDEDFRKRVKEDFNR